MSHIAGKPALSAQLNNSKKEPSGVSAHLCGRARAVLSEGHERRARGCPGHEVAGYAVASVAVLVRGAVRSLTSWPGSLPQICLSLFKFLKIQISYLYCCNILYILVYFITVLIVKY